MGTFSTLALLALLAVVNARLITHEKKIPNSYIVRFKNSVTRNMMHSTTILLRTHGYHVDELPHVHSATVKGHITASDLQDLENSPDVEYLEEDGVINALAFGGCSAYNDNSLPWGLDAIDPRGQDGVFNIDDSIASSNDVTVVYVLDTGVDKDHPDFQGRVEHVFTAITSGSDAGYDDYNGHGTHCAGTVAGYYFGVSKRAFIGNVRVLNAQGSGSYSGVIAGINAAADHHRNRASRNGYAKSVISMSLGGGKSQSVNDACNDAVAAGVVTSVAAGNDNRDASNYSPASASDVICVGAVDQYYNLASFSNYGSTVDILAPGVSVKAAWSSKARRRRRSTPRGIDDFDPSADLAPPSVGPNQMRTATISGTSMACPHVSGVIAAYMLGHQGAPPSPAAIKSWVTSQAKTNIIDLRGKNTTPNLFLQAKQC